MSSDALAQLMEPRDANQVHYMQRNLRHEFLLNLTEKQNADVLAGAWGPECQTICHPTFIDYNIMMQPAVNEIARFAKLRILGERPMVYHYDTTFNCGDYYVSTLLLT